jgi:hypothetical protein
MGHDEAIVRLWGELQDAHYWRLDRGYWVYKKSVAIGLSLIGDRWKGPMGKSPIANDCVLLNHLVVIQNQRKRGLALEALKELAATSDTSRCGLVGVVSPFSLKRKNIYDIKVLVQRMLLGEYEVLPTEMATNEIRSVCSLFDRAGYDFGYKFQKLSAYQNESFPAARQFAYLPDGLDETTRLLIEATKLPELAYVDDLDDFPLSTPEATTIDA